MHIQFAGEKHITVWDFEDAPEKYRAMSNHGGDEDWVAFVPAHLKDRYIPWIEDCTQFGPCDTTCHTFEDGSRLFIGAHA